MKSSNTARWAALLVPGCELRSWAGRPDAALLEDLGRPGDWLLFPASGAPTSDPALPRPERVVVLDGTWRQVRRMLRSLPALQRLPRLSVSARTGWARLRAAPSPDFLSTLEAIAGAVALLEGEPAAAPLDACHRALVTRALSARGRRLPEAA
jgi:DTW domain-containing protein YfiP